MKRLGLAIVAAGLVAAAVISYAQAPPNSSGTLMVPNGGGSSGGTFPPTGCATANGVIFNNATPCDAGFTKAAGATGTIVVGGQLSFPNAGSAGTPNIPADFGTGIYFPGGSVGFVIGTGSFLTLDATSGIRTGSATPFGWGSSTLAGSSAPDTVFCRQAAGVIEVGTLSACNALGSMLMTAITTTGTVTLSNLTTGTNADFLCLSAGGVVLIQATACTISTLAHKPDWKAFEDDAVASIRRLEVGTFHFDDKISNDRDPNSRSLQLGLNAENIAAVVPEAAVYEDDMKTPKSYRQESVIALLVKAIQEQQAQIDGLKHRLDETR